MCTCRWHARFRVRKLRTKQQCQYSTNSQTIHGSQGSADTCGISLDYGDFWLLVQLHSSDQLAKSMGILRRVPTINLGLQKYRKAIVELNNLVKATLELIDSI
ncbi:hypothetical protein CJ030_MR8G020397 [Morella rubra]|uniref:Sieve element occlusion N-terminal domain-containing protein n=1 Tax=Morella rubra TaxID=262757 RepID=A0A6A1UYX6_9ROSI|nr:hypothetical protein CJ030_MR8G020397 [Morella rubra]